MRLAKLIAISGFASRREAENIIISGRIRVNGIIINNIVTLLKCDDVVFIDNIDISQWLKPGYRYSQTQLWIFYKPKGYITSHKDPQGRPTIFSILPRNMQNILTIGRLDLNTEGLLLLTNNGELARYFELPKNDIERVYRCRLFGPTMRHNDLNELRNGITIDGMRYKNIEIVQDNDKWFTVTLREGKNREIRRIFEYLDMQVTRLIRIQYGEFKLDNIYLGDVVEVSRPKVLKYVNNLSEEYLYE